MTDEEIAKILEDRNEEYRKVELEHRELKEKLSAFGAHAYLNPEEEAEKKSLQKQKLKKKDQMAEMVRKYRESVSLN